MKFITSKSEVAASNEVFLTLIRSLDLVNSKIKHEWLDSADRINKDFSGMVADLQKSVIDAGQTRMITITHYEVNGEEFVSFDMNPEFYKKHAAVLLKHAPMIGNILNNLIGLCISLKSAFKALGFADKALKNDLATLVSDFTDTKETDKA